MHYLRQESGFYRGVFRLMIPMIIQNFVSQSILLIDSLMVGTLGEIQLAAVTASTTPFFIVQLVCFGLQSGATVMTAQYHGRGNTSAINRVLGISCMSSLLVTSIMAMVTLIFPMNLMQMLTNNADLHGPGAEYARIVGFSYIFFSVSSMYTSIQRSLGNTKLGAYIFTTSSLLKVFFNWVLIFGNLGAPALGITGAAITTVLIRILELIVVIIHMNRGRFLKLDFKLVFRPGMLITRDFARVALPVGLGELLWAISMSLFAIIMGHMPGSTAILAAQTIAGNVERVLSVAIMAVGSTAGIVIGNEIGSGNSEKVYGKAVAINMLAFGIGAVSGLLIFILRLFAARQFLFPVMGMGSEAQEVCMFMLMAMVFIQPLRALNMTNIVGVFRGGGDVIFSLVADILPLYAVCIPLAALFGLKLGLGIVPVFLCKMLDEILKTLMTVPRVRSKKWINNITRQDV